jgi:nitrogenase molybdenum-iron protein alpha chain
MTPPESATLTPPTATTPVNDIPETKAFIKEVIEAYPDKAKKKREKHLNVFEEGKSDCGVKSNIKSVPGSMTTRGCAYAGSKGVVWGPIKDMIHISHEPVGCGYYSWSGRRNYYIGTTGIDSFGTMDFTSDFQERDIVFGGDKKLLKLITELDELFPLNRGVSIQSECPIGLIGDDIEAVAKKAAKEIGKTVVPVRCEGFRGVSQSDTTSPMTQYVTGFSLNSIRTRKKVTFQIVPPMMLPLSVTTTLVVMLGLAAS